MEEFSAKVRRRRLPERLMRSALSIAPQRRPLEWDEVVANQCLYHRAGGGWQLAFDDSQLAIGARLLRSRLFPARQHSHEGHARTASLRTASLSKRFEEFLNLHRGHAAGSGGGDGLAVAAVLHVATGEHAGHLGEHVIV